MNVHDIDAVVGCITDDCVFEDTTPPDGTRRVGREAMLGAARQFFADSPAATFSIEGMFTAGDRALIRWRYAWADGHVRGVDVMRVTWAVVEAPAAFLFFPDSMRSGAGLGLVGLPYGYDLSVARLKPKPELAGTAHTLLP